MSTRAACAAPTVRTPPPETIDRIVAGHWWYHRMDLGAGRQTTGTYGDNLIPVAHLIRHVRLGGMKCLDVGAMDCKMSFLMEREGADVLAVDGVAKPGALALIDAYGSSVRYRSGVIVERLPDLLSSDGLFDFVLCSGVAYHVYSPFDLFANLRRLLRNGGMAIIETAVIPDDANLFMTLNRGDYYKEHTTLWIPSTACVRYMLRFLSMRVLGESELRHGARVARHAWLVQAERPGVMARQTDDPWLATLLGKGAPGWSHEYLKPQLDLDAFESRPPSAIAAAPVACNRLFDLGDPDGYREEAALLSRATPAWRILG